MARTPNARVVLNRGKLNALQLMIADGVGAWCAHALSTVKAPDGEPYGKGLPDRWGWAVYVDGRKVADGSGNGTAVTPPRAAAISRVKGLGGIIGWGFPARFNEIGTVKMAAQPFFAAAILAAAASFPESIRSAIGGRL